MNLLFDGLSSSGDWLDLGAERAGRFVAYSQILDVPAGHTEFRLQLEFKRSSGGSGTAFVDDLRVYYPREVVEE